MSYSASKPLRDTLLDSDESEVLSGHEEGGNFLPYKKNVTKTHQGLRMQPQQQENLEIYLFSLNWVQESDPEYFLKKDVRRLWEWKDTALGDGRDFFVPKPKTLMALQHYLLENIPNLMECSIISNCARLEILCSHSYPSPFEKDGREGETNYETQQGELLARDISNCFVAQLDHHTNTSKKSNAWNKMFQQLPMNVDNPDSVLTTMPPSINPMKPISRYDSWWNVTVGSKAILTHICKVSAGMGRRPRRPDRPVIFRPFSSRDAHVLLQLKRTRENVGTKTEDENSSSKQPSRQKLLPIILDYALRAGKAARNSNIVPEILELKEMTSAESSIISASEQQTSERVANAAYEKGIQPLIMECVAKLNDSANNIDRIVVEFRQNAFVFLKDMENEGDHDDEKILQQDLRSWLNRRLHEPTVELRSLSREQNGNANGDVESYLSNSLKEIRDGLQEEYYRRRRELNKLGTK